MIPAAGGELARDVVRAQWPPALVSTGALALGAGLALSAGPRLVLGAGILALLDLLWVNGALNPSTDAAFFTLRPEIREVVEPLRAEGPYRWFSYGVARSPALRWNPAVARRDSDVWLFYLDRQSLLPRAPVLDGLDGAFDIDRMGLAPAGSTLSVEEARPALFRHHYRRLRLAGVRWVVGFHPLPEDLVRLRASVPLPEVAEPLRLHELRDPLPRAFWVGEAEVEADPTRRAARLEDPAFDPRRTVLLEAPPPAGAAGPAGAWPRARASSTRRSTPTPCGSRRARRPASWSSSTATIRTGRPRTSRVPSPRCGPTGGTGRCPPPGATGASRSATPRAGVPLPWPWRRSGRSPPWASPSGVEGVLYFTVVRHATCYSPPPDGPMAANRTRLCTIRLDTSRPER